MEFNEKLQELRRLKGLTQEDVAEALFVSRTAVSKWESGRGYPNIESLKGIARLFGVTVDELLSGEELLSLAEQDTKHRESRIRDLIFGLLDVSTLLFLFFPLFGQQTGEVVRSVSLLSLTEISPWLKTLYFLLLGVSTLFGIITLALQGCDKPFWRNGKGKISLILNVLSICLFTLCRQPYAAVLLLLFATVKFAVLTKNPS